MGWNLKCRPMQTSNSTPPPINSILGNECKKSYLNNLAKLTRFEPCTVRLGRIDHTSMPPCRDYNWPHFVFILAQREGSNFHRHFAA